MALGTALALQLGTTAAGALADRVLNPRPDIPDLSAEAQAEFSERRRDLDSILDTRRRKLQADLAASGRTGSAGASSRQEVFGSFAESQADLASRGAQAVADAEQRENLARFRQQSQRAANRTQAISDLVRGVGGTLALNQLESGGVDDEATDPDSGARGTPPGGFDGSGGTFNAFDFMRDDLESRYGISRRDVETS